MPDFNSVAQVFLEGLAAGVGFTVPLIIGLRMFSLELLSHPTVRAIARAADKVAKKGEGGFWGFLGNLAGSFLGPPKPPEGQ